MSWRAILFLLVLGYLLFMAFRKHPFYGVLAYIFEYYNHPPLYWWGAGLPELRWSLYTALIALAAVSFNLHKLNRSSLMAQPMFVLMALLGINAYLVAPLGINPPRHFEQAMELAKISILYILFFKTFATEDHLRKFFFLVIAGTFIWGFIGWEDPHFEEGRLEGIGGPDTNDSNGAPAQAIFALPLLGYFFFIEKDKRIKIALAIAGVFILNFLILCNSRASFLALAAMAIYGIIFARKRIQKYNMIAALGGVLLFGYLGNENFWERMTTVFVSTEEERDHSAVTRETAWRAGVKMWLDQPFGCGGGGSSLRSPQYMDVEFLTGEEGFETRALHNTYLQIAVDYGTQAFVMYAAMVFLSFHYLWAIRRRYTPDTMAYVYAFSMELAVVGTLVGSFFINRGLHEGPYWIFAFAAIMHNIYITNPQASGTKSLDDDDEVVLPTGETVKTDGEPARIRPSQAGIRPSRPRPQPPRRPQAQPPLRPQPQPPALPKTRPVERKRFGDV